ncbi:amino acid permease, partial [Pseudomonas sp. MWU13-2860]
TCNGVPLRALLLSIFALLSGVLLNYLVPEKVFVWVTSLATFGAIWTWVIILLAQLRFRRTLSREQLATLAYKMPFWPYGSYIAMGFLVLVVGLMAYFPDTRIALIIGPGWLAFLVVAYYLLGYNKRSAEEVARLAQNAR